MGVNDIRERTVTIPSGVTEIGVSAFNTCLGLYDIIIPDSVMTIHGTAFAGTSWVTIHGGVSSAAIRYAKEKGLDYAISVTGISFDSKTIQLKKGDSAYLEVTVMPETATNQEVVWSTSNENIVTVDDGYIEGIAAGTATITATAEDGSGVYAQCKVTVTEPYIVKFNGNGGTKLSKSKITISKPNAKIGTLPTVIRKGYSFKGWYTAKTGGKKITSSTKISKSMTLYAQWTKTAAPGKGNAPTLKSKKSGQITVSFKKVSKAKGYQITYSTSKKFTKSTTKTATVTKTTAILKSLKKGRSYYVKVRAYTTDSSGKKVYGVYSTVKNVKVKK